MSKTAVGTFRVLDPREEARPKVVDLAPRLADLNGKVVGFLDISKSKGDIFLREVEELLTEKYHFAEIIRRRKPTFAKPAPKEIYDELIERCDIVIEALAD